MKLKFQSSVALILVVLILNSCLMPNLSFAANLTGNQANSGVNTLTPQAVAEAVYEGVYATPVPLPINTGDPMNTLIPETILNGIPTVIPNAVPTPLEEIVPDEGLNGLLPSEEKNIILPLKEDEENQNSILMKNSVTGLAKVLKHSFKYNEILGTEENSIAASTPDNVISIIENEVMVLNDENSTEKKSSFMISFVPETTATYLITVSQATISHMEISDSQNNTLTSIRHWPELSNSIACKLYKDQQYTIELYVNQNAPTDLSVKKYVSENTELIYKFDNNTYIEEDNASIIVTAPKLPADLLFGVLERDLLFKAELIKEGVLIDSISEIPADCIRGATGTPDDNVLQFVCNFNKHVDNGVYTVRVTCKDREGDKVIESCKAEVKIGNNVILYAPLNAVSCNGHGRVYFKDINSSVGKFVISNSKGIIGVTGNSSINSTQINCNAYLANYTSTMNTYNEDNFERTLYCAEIPSFTFKELLKPDSKYSFKFVTGVSEYPTQVRLIVTDKLIIDSIYCSSLYDVSSNVMVNVGFSNLKNADADKINVELVDLYENTVASKIDYAYAYGDSQIKFRLKLDKPIDKNSKYSLRISYPEGICTNVETAEYSSYTSSNKLYLKSAKIMDSEKALMRVYTEQCDKNINYDVVLYRENKNLRIPISKLSGVKADEEGTFLLQFPKKSELGLLTQGGSYYLEFTCEGSPQTYGIGFSMPGTNDSTGIDKEMTFYPPVLPSTGKIEFTISGYEIDNGIMGADNENINIELIADNETYGVMDKATIDKSVSVYRANSSYTIGQVMIKGTLNISKALKDETKYYIRINGTDYDYFYNSSEGKINTDYCELVNYTNSSSFKDLSGTEQIVYSLSKKQLLELNCRWVRNISEGAKLVLVNLNTKEEIEGGIWKTIKTNFGGEFKDISCYADISKLELDDIYEICVQDGDTNYTLNKYIKVFEPNELYYLTVKQAVYGSDTVTMQFGGSSTWDGYTFNIKDSFDNIIDCTYIDGSVRNSSINYVDVDFKLDTPLKYGKYTVRAYNAKDIIRGTSYFEVSAVNDVPSVQGVQEGFPFLVHGKNLVEESLYTGDIFDVDNAVQIKKAISLSKRPGEDVLEISDSSLEGVPIGNYWLTVKADGKLVGNVPFYYGGSLKLKPLVLASEWEDGTFKRPFISSNRVELSLRTLYYTKVRYSESIEGLETKAYQAVTNSVGYEFGSTVVEKVLYFRFSDDYGNESDVIVFKAYLSDAKNDISILSPEEGLSYAADLNIMANVANNPHFVGALLNSKTDYNEISSSSIKLSKKEGTDTYSALLSKSQAEKLVKVEVFTTDEVGNINAVKTVLLKEPADKPVTVSNWVSINSLVFGDNKTDLTVKGRTSTASGNVTIRANDKYGYYESIRVVADGKGDFTGMLHLKSDGNYTIWAEDSYGQSYARYVTVDTIAPVLKDYATVAQGIDSVRISWDVTDVTDVNTCTYTIWKDGKILESQYNSKQYLAVGLTKGTTYIYKIMAKDATGNQSEPIEIKVTVGDDEASSIPANLKVISHAGKSITLSWDASTDNSYVTGYEIFRNGEKAGISYTTSFTDTKLLTGVEYSYKVRSFDPSMNYSEFSGTIVHSPATTSIKDAYEGSYYFVSSKTSSITLKALSTDVLNKSGTYVLFEYSADKGETWTTLGSSSIFTTTPDGLLFSTVWNISWYESGKYLVRYTVNDRDGFTDKALSQVFNIQKEEDIIVPSIKSLFSPKSSYAKTIPLAISAEDNIGLKSIVLQSSIDGTTWADLNSVNLGDRPYNYTWNYNIDVSAITEGEYYVKAIAIDMSDNKSNSTPLYNKYIIDRTAPEKLTDISFSSTIDFVELKWNVNSGSDIEMFTVLRSQSADGQFTVIASYLAEKSYKDIRFDPGKTYYYKVVCYDVAGNESEQSEAVEVVTATLPKDETKPVIASFISTRLGAALNLIIGVQDNIGVKNVKYLYRLDQSTWNELTDIAMTPERISVVYSNYAWNVASLKDGTYEIKAIAYDEAGNISEEKIISVTIRNTPVAPPLAIEVVAGEVSVDVIWGKAEDNLLDKYKLYRSVDGQDYQLVEQSVLRSYTDREVQQGSSYTYKVIAVDVLGNESTGTVSKLVSVLPDITPPQINKIIPSKDKALNGIVSLSALSVDNVKVAQTEIFYSTSGESDSWISLGVTTSGTIEWNTKNTADGMIYIKAEVKDTSNNKSELVEYYKLDNTAPNAPVLSASTSELKVLLSWSLGVVPEDFDHYKVYKSGDAKTFVLASATDTGIYTDYSPFADSDNYYRVTAVDRIGNESVPSNIVNIKPEKDKTLPVIKKFLPEDGAAVRNGFTLAAYAEDNIGVKKYSFQFRSVDKAGKPVESEEWTNIAEVAGNGREEVNVKWNLNSEAYPDGYYQFRVSVIDDAGNVGQKVCTYVLANNPLLPPDEVYVKAGEWQFAVSWSPVLRSDFSHYVLYRKEGRGGNWEKILNNTTTNIYIDKMRDPQKEYFYSVSAVNDLGVEGEKSYDYSKDEQASENIDTRALQQTSIPIILNAAPVELSRTNSVLELETDVCDTVNVKTIYEYAYIGQGASSEITGNEQWHLIGEDTTTEIVPALDLIDQFENILELKNVPSAAEGETCFKTSYRWDVSALSSGTYAVRATTVNKGNKETSLTKKYIVDRELPGKPSTFVVTDTKAGGELHLAWERSSAEDVNHYVLYRAIKSGGSFTAIADTKSLVYSDTKLDNGSQYFYTISAVDTAGNESDKTNQISAIPTSMSDLEVTEVKSSTGLPTYGREGELTALVKNSGFALAKGSIDFYVQAEEAWEKIGSTTVNVKSMNNQIASIKWTPSEALKNSLNIKAVVTTMSGSEDLNKNNNEFKKEILINKAPEALISTKEWVYSGDIFTLDGSKSQDSDGRIESYLWKLGDGVEKKGAGITYMYQLPGDYNINLLVTDNSGSQSSMSVSLQVYDNRPDLVVSDLIWSPEDTQEGDVVRVTAKIGNTGEGPNRQGFLTGFYIDNQYMGYVRVDKSINPGEIIEVPFTWIAKPGVHVLKVVANDILDNLKEIDKDNNSKIAALTSSQVNFADVKVVEVTCTSGGDINIDSESPFGYRTKISNIGTLKAETFFVALYIDGVWTAKQHINTLDVGETREITFVVKPISGKHEIEIAADDPAPVLLELDRDNNKKSIITPDFVVTYPKLELSPITWLPEDIVLTEGTSLTFETKVKNTGEVDIKNKFDIDFKVDDLNVRTITVDGLNKGEEKNVWARWVAEPGSHKVNIAADTKQSVISSVYGVQVDAKTPYLEIIYPDLNISDVQYSTASIKYGHPVSFIARVSNQSVSSIFDKFNVTLYIDGKQVTGKVVEGLRGHSTAIVDLTWTPDKIGDVDVKIVVDEENVVRQKPIIEGVSRIYEESFNIADALVVEAHPNEEDQDETLGKLFYSTTNRFIPLQVKARRASNSKLLGPEEGIKASYTLVGEIPDVNGQVTTLKGEIGFDPATREFIGQLPITKVESGDYTLATGQLPITTLESGNYTLTIEVEEGASKEPSIRTYINITKETVGKVETNKEAYQHGETAHVSGNYRYRDGTPVKNERIVIDFCLEPKLKTPRMGVVDGKQITMFWHAETVRFVYTDENGNFEYDFVPTTLGAGKWHVYTFAYDLGAGNAASTDFNVWGMTASPSKLSLVSTKNSNFSKFIAVNNMAKAEQSLNGISAVLVDLTSGSGVRAVLDTSSLSSVIDPSGSSGVTVNFNVPLDAADTAEYQVIFSSKEGATTASNIKLYLRPAIPYPVIDPKGIKMGVNPGAQVVKTVTVTNKGLGRMENIVLKSPEGLTWIKGINLEKVNLEPGESTKFEVLINPPEGTPFGQYQDNIIVTDGKYSAFVTVGAEVTSINKGSLSFLVKDDMGEMVENAEVTLVSQNSYVQVIKGQETSYYQNHYGKTDSKGVVTFEDVPLGEYNYKIRAKGRNSVTGNASVMAMMESALVEVSMETEPIQMEWTVTPTTIEDKYEIQLELTFGANLPVPKFGALPPWLTVTKQVTLPTILEATIVNTGVVAITDVMASVLREENTDVGISLVGGGYIGEIPAHGSARIGILVQPGYYNLTYGINEKTKMPYNCIVLQGSYVSFDRDTGLPVSPAEKTVGAVALYNPGEQKATLVVDDEKMEIVMPDEQLQELDYFVPLENGNQQLENGDVAYQIATLKLSQNTTIERQAFDATLKVSNGYTDKALQNLEVRLLITDKEGNDVTGKNFIIPEGVKGISAIDGSASLSSGDEMSATWQLIPGEGLGGETQEGKVYLAQAIVSYYVNGRYVETKTKQEELAILPQPKIKLNYYIPGKIYAGVPFRMGVVAENIGNGEAKNLVINSGQLDIKTNQAGLLTRFEIVENSFGSKTGNNFSLKLGDIGPHSSVNGCWLVKWTAYEDGQKTEETEPIEGEFRSFKASLNYLDYKGTQLNPLIVDVKTEILGKDNLYADGSGTDGVLSLVDIGETGFPNYLINISTGMKLPIYVPQSLKVEKQPDLNENTLEFSVPVNEGDPDKPDMPRYQVLLIKDPLPNAPISTVTRNVSGEAAVDLSKNNIWKNNGNIYFVDTIPTKTEKPDNYLKDQQRYYYPTKYTVDFSSGAVLGGIEYARIYYDTDPVTLKKISKFAYYDIGTCTSEGELTSVRASVYNQGTSIENLTVEFFATRLHSRGEEKETIKIGEAKLNNLKPLYQEYAYCNWKPFEGGDYILRARIAGREFDKKNQTKAHINYIPYADAGVDFSVDVQKPARFDGTRSYDKDGYIQSFIWEFGNGESGTGANPVYTYRYSGTYKVKLTVMDNDYVTTTSQMQITVKETRPDLRVSDIKLSNDNPEEGEKITITATVFNGGESGTDKAFLVGLYSNNMFKDCVEIKDSIKKGEYKEVTFERLYSAGDYLITVVANDMGRPVDEADFDNNQRSAALKVDNSYFANLKVTDFTWDGANDGVLDWNQDVTLSATVENDGMANAENFSLVFYADGKMIEAKTVKSLAYVEGYGNSTKVTAVWKAKSEGVHTFKVVADGFVPRVLEMNRSDNEKEFKSPGVRLRYPDLGVESASIDRTTIEQGQQLIVNLVVKNEGYANVSTPFSISAYADNYYIGTKQITEVGKNAAVATSFAWDRPVKGVGKIRFIVDEYNQVSESDEKDNAFEYRLDSPLNVKLPQLNVEEIKTTPDSGMAKFNDTLSTTIKIRNSGNAPVNKPFTTALYVNDKLAGSIRTSTVVYEGTTISGVIDWKAEVLPTAPDYKLTVYADVYGELQMTDSSIAIGTAAYKVLGELQVENLTSKAAYTTGEQPQFTIKATSTDELWRPLGTDEGVSAELNIYEGTIDSEGNPTGPKVFTGSMIYDSVDGVFGKQVDKEFTEGSYTAQIAVRKGTEEKTVYSSLKMVADYLVAVESEKQTYAVGEKALIKGRVTAKDGVSPIASTDVTVKIVGEKEWTGKFVTNQDGYFGCTFLAEGGFGGSYSLKAEAKVNGAVKSSEDKVFYVEGLYLSALSSAEVTLGYTKDLKVTLVNVGTIPLTSINITKAFEKATENFEAAIEGQVPEKLMPGKSVSLYVKIKASKEAMPGEDTLKLKVDCAEDYTYTSSINVKILEARPEYNKMVDMLGGINEEGIEVSVRPGSMVTRVVNITNIGTGEILNLEALSPEKLPWITLTVSETELKNSETLSIRDKNSHAIIAVNFAPDEYVRAGIYEDVLTIKSNAGTITIPLKVNVGAANRGTIILAAVNKDYAPVEDAIIKLIGPHTSDLEAPAEDAIYTGMLAEAGAYRFENIPEGIYTLKVSAKGYEDLVRSITVQALINEIPQKIVLEKKKVDYSPIKDDPENDEPKKGELPTIEPIPPVRTDKPQLISNYPGDEVFIEGSDISAGNTGGQLTITNIAKIDSIFGVQAEFTYEGSDLSNDCMNLKYGKLTENPLILGDFGAGESKDLGWMFDLSCLYYKAEVNALDIPGEYSVKVPEQVTAENFEAWLKGLAKTYYDGESAVKKSWDPASNTYVISVPQNEDGSFTAPKGNIQKFYGRKHEFDMNISLSGTINQNNKEEAVTLSIPVRINYYPPDLLASEDVGEEMKTIIVKETVVPVEGSTAVQVPKQKIFSDFFLIARCGIDLADIPKAYGNALAAFEFSQDVAVVDEAIDAEFTFSNHSDEIAMKDLKFTLEILNVPLKPGSGNLPAGAKRFTDWFIFDPGEIKMDSLAAGMDKTINYTIKSKASMGDISGDYYAYVSYEYTYGNVINMGFIGPVKFTIEPPPKLYISYNVEDLESGRYKLNVVITNTGGGTAHNVSFGLPSIAGKNGIVVGKYDSGSESGVYNINIGNIAPGDTLSTSLEITADELQVEKLKELSLQCTQRNDKIVIVPKSMQMPRRSDFNDLAIEVDRLEKNLIRLMDKTIEDLAEISVNTASSVCDIEEAKRFALALEAIPKALSIITFALSTLKRLKKWEYVKPNVYRGGYTINMPGIVPYPTRVYLSEQEMELLEKLQADLVQINDAIEERKTKIENNHVNEEGKAVLESEIVALEKDAELIINRIAAILNLDPGDEILDFLHGQFGVTGLVGVIKWCKEVEQFNANSEEIYKMMEEILQTAFDEIKAGRSKDEVKEMVIWKIKNREFHIIDSEDFEELLFKSYSSGLSEEQFNSALQELSKRSEKTVISELYYLVHMNLMEAKRSIGNSATNGPAYYPVEPMLEYLIGLNEGLEAMWSKGNNVVRDGYGNYKNTIVYTPAQGELIPYEVQLEPYKDAIIKSMEWEILQNKYLVERWKHNQFSCYLNIFEIVDVFIKMLPKGTVVGLLYPLLGNYMLSPYRSYKTQTNMMLDHVEEELIAGTMENFRNLNNTADISLSKELEISQSVKSMFVAVEEWRKIDPPLPVEVMSIVVPDVTVENGSEAGLGKAVLKIKNAYTGILTISPLLEIYDSRGLLATPEGSPFTLQPGETSSIEIPFTVPRSTMQDAGGYTAVVYFGISESVTMSIGETKGPYVVHFFAGNNEQIEARRAFFELSQPIGGDINPGDMGEVIINSEGNNGEIRLFMVAKAGTKLELGVYDPQGNFAGILEGAKANQVDGIQIGGLKNSMDYIRIVNPIKGEYRAVVKNPQGDESESYALSVVKLPDLGAIPDISYPYLVTSFSRNIGFEVDVFESSMRNDLGKVSFEVDDLRNNNGYAVPAESLQFKTTDDSEIAMVPAGKGMAQYLTVILPENAPDGIYVGLLTVTVEGSNLNPALIKQTGTMTVTDSVYGWSDSFATNEAGLEVYKYKMPIIITLDTSKPETPVLHPIIAPSYESTYAVIVEGEAPSGTEIIIWVDEINEDSTKANSEGKFKASLTLERGSHKIYATAINENGSLSKPSQEYTVVVEGNKAPEIVPLSPVNGVKLYSQPEKITFRINSGDGIVNKNSIIAKLNGKVVALDKLIDMGDGIWNVLTNEVLAVGTNIIEVTVKDNLGNNSKLSWEFVLAQKDIEEPPVEDPKTEDPKTEDPKTEDPKAEDPKTEEPKTEKPPVTGGTSGGKTETPVVNPPVAQPEVVIPGSTEENLLVKIDEKGRITVIPQLDEARKTGVAKVIYKDIQTAFEKVEIGNSEEKKVSIELKEIAKADSYELQLPSSIFTLKDGSKVIEVITAIGTLELPDNIFGAEYIKDAENVTITLSNANISDLSSEYKKQVGDKPVIQFNMSVDGKPVKNIDIKSAVRLYVDYTPTTEEAKKSDRIFIWYIDESGKMTAVTNAKYDNTTGKVAFKVKNYGRYAVAIEDKTFDDILNYKWAKDQIEILASKGIINGTSSTKYSPGKNITRADAVVLIVKALGLEAEFSKNFDDVSQEKYYYKSVGIARSLGIITGVGNDMFKPETSVTRQDLMVIVDKALKVAGISIEKGDISDLDIFKDASQISPYAKEGIASLVEEGIIKGDDKGIIAPFRSITRAETAVMVYAMYLRQLDSILVKK